MTTVSLETAKKLKAEGSKWRKHGMTGTRFYKAWENMKSRCVSRKRHNSKHYAIKGITVCEAWREDFCRFKEDMYESYVAHAERFGEENTTLDRIDGQLDYYPENCRWATYKVQSDNAPKKKTKNGKYRNVYKRKDSGNYQVQIKCNQKNISFGTYSCKEEARKVAEKARRMLAVSKT